MDSCTLAFLSHFAGWLAGGVGLFAVGWLLARRVWRLPGRWRLPATGLAVLLLLTLPAVMLFTFLRFRQEQSTAVAETTRLDQRDGLNLVASRPPSRPEGRVVTWTATGLGAPRSDTWATLAEGGTLTSGRVWVTPGMSYTYTFHAYRPENAPAGVLQIRLLWQDAALHAFRWQDSAPLSLTTPADMPAGVCGDASFMEGVGVAPPGAAYLQLVVTETRGTGLLGAVNLTADGVTVEPFPDAQRAALAFSFDWESAMGGPGHSKGAEEHDVAAATRGSLAMRQGADYLLRLFATQAVSGTFYATGYNLLDGNTARRLFAGNPTYAWPKPKWGWATDYWTTHPWYQDDPFGTAQSDPAWYFGDQTNVLLAAGQEIGSHTFGHLYVRGSTPDELNTDLTEWDAAATAKHLPPLRTFAFPWQSSNSLIKDGQSAFYDVLRAHGVTSVTRLYPGDVVDRYALGAVPLYITPTMTVSPAIAVMPDFLLGPACAGDVVVTGTTASGVDEAGGRVGDLTAARQVIDLVLARHGVTSFWNHPEQLATDTATQGLWRDTVTYAVGKRAAGLWIAPVGTISDYMQATRQVEVAWRNEGREYLVIVTNHNPAPLAGVTLSFPISVGTATVEGRPAPSISGTLVVLPSLAPGVAVSVVARPAGAGP